LATTKRVERQSITRFSNEFAADTPKITSLLRTYNHANIGIFFDFPKFLLSYLVAKVSFLNFSDFQRDTPPNIINRQYSFAINRKPLTHTILHSFYLSNNDRQLSASIRQDTPTRYAQFGQYHKD
jgi:hypothetical protein